MLTNFTAWKELTSDFMRPLTSLRQLFESDPDRANKYTRNACGIHLDFSKNWIDDDRFQKLIALAEEAQLTAKIGAMVANQAINQTENRSVNHIHVRDSSDSVSDHCPGLAKEFHQAYTRMSVICEQVNGGQWLGHKEDTITDVVALGIGGSFLGPKILSESLKPFWQNKVKLHYVANVDGCHIRDVLAPLNQETTLVIIASKSFSTQETLLNAETAKQWLLESCDDRDLSAHLIAISTNIEAAQEFGVSKDNILPMWDGIGGRYSVWSTIGLPLALQIGMNHFSAFLRGAHEMDEHFIRAPFEDNLPVLMALLGIMYINGFDAQSHALLPYYHYLRGLPAYVQQMDMESNGKSCDQDGNKLNYNTGPIIWGSEGTNGQHSFHQLLHQGSRLVPADFILPLTASHDLQSHHDALIANGIAQSQALMLGRDEHELQNEEDSLVPHKVMPGNRPSNTLYFDELTPKQLGSLIALYEHKVFVQGHLWGINSFDQWGVELGKSLGNKVLAAFSSSNSDEFDSSTQGIIDAYKRKRATE